MKQSVRIASTVLVAGILAGCTTMNEQTGQRDQNRAGTGALIGAAAGALAGGLIGDGKKAAIIGAGVGAIGGAAVGTYMDKQEKALRQDLKGTGVEVERQGDNIKLNMPSAITFDVDQAMVKPQFYPILDDIAQTLVTYESTLVNIEGHTDSTGSDQHNQQLSVNRANSVSSYLYQRGVIQERLLTYGYGESSPVATNETPEGRQANRRVEITLVPVTK